MLFGKFEESGSWASTLFPETWCAKTYHAIHPDLAEMDDTTLEDHYAQYGKNEGRQSCPVRNRLDFIELLNTIRPALEIGAFDAPLLEQTRVKHFDVLDQAELRKRASELNRNAQTVPYIDYFSAEADLSIVTEKFKLITSSHAIEHTPDLVRHLLDVEKILTDDGVYALMIPDCRYCFDHFISPTTIADIFQAYVEKRRVHTLASVIEHRALTTHNDPARHWRKDHGQPIGTDTDRLAASIREWQNSNGGYIDVHAWQFTPDTFALNIALLKKNGLISLKPLRVYQTVHGANEFLAVLSR